MKTVHFTCCALLLAACTAEREHRLALVSSSAAATLDAARAAVPVTTAEAHRVWAGAGADMAGSPSPDGKFLAVTHSEGTSGVGVRDLATGQTRMLARAKPGAPEFSEYARFSPDGRRIAYSWFNVTAWELRVIAIDGSEPRVVVPPNADVRYLRPSGWSPDGKEILTGIVRTDGSVQLALANATTGTIRVLRSYAWDEAPSGAAFSPDGRYIAIGRRFKDDPKREIIVVVSADGSHEAKVIDSPGENVVHGWADGRLFYSTAHDGTAAVFAVPMRDGKTAGAPEMLKADFVRALPMGLTSDGRLFYGEFAGNWDVYVASIDAAAARLLSSPTRATHRLIGFNQGIDWTADGGQAAYLVRTGPTPNSPAIIAIRDEQSGEVREVKPALGYINGRIRWSPDGRTILAQAADRKGTTGLQLIDPRTGQFTTIFSVNPKGGMVHSPAWAPNGKTIYYALADVDAGKDYRVMRRDLTTGAEEVVYAAPGLGPMAALSADARFAAVAASDAEGTTISVIPTTGGDPRVLCRVPGWTGSMEFTRDGKNVLFVRAGDVWTVPVTGGEPRAMGMSMKSITVLRTHPDGRQLGFSGGEATPEVWVLESGSKRDRATR